MGLDTPPTSLRLSTDLTIDLESPMLSTVIPAKSNRPVRVLVIENVLLRPADEARLRHCSIGEEFAVDEEDARAAVAAGRALYVDMADDRCKGKFTAGPADRERLACVLRLKKEEAERRSQVQATSGDLVAALRHLLIERQ